MSEDASNVTFVDGKAVSQQEPTTSEAPADTRDAAIKAVREAMQKANAEESGEKPAPKAKPKAEVRAEAPKEAPKEASGRGPDGKFLPKEPQEDPKTVTAKPPVQARKEAPAVTKDADEGQEEAPKSEPLPDRNKASVSQLLKNREKLAKEKLAVKEEITAEREAFRKEQEQYRREVAQMQQERQFLQQQAQRLAALKSDPARAVREAGWEPEDFIMRLAREGTPEGQADRQTQEMRHELAQLKQWREDQAKQAQDYQKRAEYERLVQYRREVENQFLTTAIKEDKYPHITNFYKGREAALISEGDIIAAEFRQLSGGREASFDEVADYIEEELANRSKSLYSKNYGTPQATGNGKAPKGNTGKALSPSMASERRSLGTSQKHLDGEERLLAAREQVKLAIAEARESED